MEDSDRIRAQRIERLAQLERLQAAARSKDQDKAGSSTSQADHNKNIDNDSAKLSTQDNNVHKHVQDHINPPPKVETAPKPTHKNVAHPVSQTVSVSYVFGLSSLEPPQEWSQVVDSIDAILWDQMVESAKNSKSKNPISYLIGVYNRSEKLTRDFPDIANQIQGSVITMSYISSTADNDDEVYGDLSAALLSAAQSSNLNSSYVTQLFTTASDDVESLPIFVHSVSYSMLEGFHFGSPNMHAIFRVLEAMADAPGVPEAMLQLPPKDSEGPYRPGVIAQQTLLGILLGVGVSGSGLARLHSESLIANSRIEELVELAKLADPVTELLDDLQFKFVEKLIRKSPSIRRLVLDWFSTVLNSNHGQMAMNRIPGRTNSLQLMLNCFKVLLRLSEPFVKLGPGVLMQQLGKINPSYFANKCSYDVSDETKVLAAQEAPFNSREQQESLNFVTECFFECAGFLHYGYHATVQAINGSLKRQIEHLEDQITAINETGGMMHPLPPFMRESTVARFQDLVQALKAELSGLKALLSNVEFIGRTLRFSEFTLAFNVYAAENYPKSGLEIRVPWDMDPPDAYASFPEFLVEAPLAAASFILHLPEFLQDPSLSVDNQLLIDACIFYMSSPKVLRNPYLRSKFVEILYFGGADIPINGGSSIPGIFSTLFTTSDTCRKFLLPALMSVFIDIEHTGRTTQFYEKFSTRELVANVFKVLWRDPHYRDQLVTESQIKPDFFVKFVALLLNDSTYLLDEALGKLLQVHKLQHEETTATAGEGGGGGSGVSEDIADGNREDHVPEREEQDENGSDDELSEGTDPASRLQSAEREARNLLQLSNSTMELLNTFTSTVPQIFATPEIIDRFAVMLNYNLAALVGPRCNQLKVRNPAALGFNPRQLLADLVRVYLNLRSQPPFPKSLSKDERSYRDENFAKAIRLLSKFSLLSPIDLENFAELAKRTKEVWQETQEEEEEFGDDIPDEYLDPLMFELMSDPVTLPTSKVNIDLSTIKTHLLSDFTDPFNRVPLKIEDVIPNPTLKAEIEEFKRQKKEQKKKKID